MGIIKRQIKKQVKKAKSKADMVNLFVPGMGIVVKAIANQVDSLTGSQRKKFYSLRTKKEKLKFLKSLK